MNTSSNFVPKSNSSPDTGKEFHSALTAASTKDASSNEMPKAKSSTQPTENKKKSADARTEAEVTPVLLTKPALPDASTQIALPVSSANEPAVQTSIQTALTAEAGVFSLSSAASSLPSLALTNQPQTGAAVQGLPDGKLDVAKGNVPASIGSVIQEKVFGANDSRPTSTKLPTAAVGIVSAEVEAVGVKPTPTTVDQGTSALRPAEPSAASVSADTASSAVQQALTAASQGVVAPVLLPNTNAVNASQPVQAISTVAGIKGNTGADTIKGPGSSQAASALKAKPAAGASDLRSKSTDGDGSATQADGSSTPSTRFVAKVIDASGPVNQGSNEASKSLDAAALQQVAPSGGSSHVSSISQGISVSAQPAVLTAPAQATPPTQEVSSAQLIQSMRSSEMKLGMQSAEFGNISISTSLSHQSLSAQISFDHLELGKALAIHLPAIEEKLGSAYGVQAKVELRDSNNPSSSQDSAYSNSGQQSREQRQSQSGGSRGTQGATFERVAAQAKYTTVSTTAASSSRLDIRI